MFGKLASYTSTMCDKAKVISAMAGLGLKKRGMSQEDRMKILNTGDELQAMLEHSGWRLVKEYLDGRKKEFYKTWTSGKDADADAENKFRAAEIESLEAWILEKISAAKSVSDEIQMSAIKSEEV